MKLGILMQGMVYFCIIHVFQLGKAKAYVIMRRMTMMMVAFVKIMIKITKIMMIIEHTSFFVVRKK